MKHYRSLDYYQTRRKCASNGGTRHFQGMPERVSRAKEFKVLPATHNHKVRLQCYQVVKQSPRAWRCLDHCRYSGGCNSALEIAQSDFGGARRRAVDSYRHHNICVDLRASKLQVTKKIHGKTSIFHRTGSMFQRQAATRSRRENVFQISRALSFIRFEDGSSATPLGNGVPRFLNNLVQIKIWKYL